MANAGFSNRADADAFAVLDDLAFSTSPSYIEHAWSKLVRNSALRDRLHAQARRPAASPRLRRLIEQLRGNRTLNAPAAAELRNAIGGLLGGLVSTALAAQGEAIGPPAEQTTDPAPTTPLMAL